MGRWVKELELDRLDEKKKGELDVSLPLPPLLPASLSSRSLFGSSSRLLDHIKLTSRSTFFP